VDTAQVDADRRRAVRSGALGIAFDTAGRAEAVMQLLLVEQVIAQLRLTGLERELGPGRERPYGAELGADRAVAFQCLRGVDFDGVSDGAAVAASGIAFGFGHGVLLKSKLSSRAQRRIFKATGKVPRCARDDNLALT